MKKILLMLFGAVIGGIMNVTFVIFMTPPSEVKKFGIGWGMMILSLIIPWSAIWGGFSAWTISQSIWFKKNENPKFLSLNLAHLVFCLFFYIVFSIMNGIKVRDMFCDLILFKMAIGFHLPLILSILWFVTSPLLNFRKYRGSNLTNHD